MRRLGSVSMEFVWVALAVTLVGAGCGSGGGAATDAAKDQVGAQGGAGAGGTGSGGAGVGDAGTGGAPIDSALDLSADPPADESADRESDLSVVDLSTNGAESGVDGIADTAIDAGAEVSTVTDTDAGPETNGGGDGGSDGPLTAMAKHLLTGRARLVGTPTTACSSVPVGAAAADHWCAFTLPGQALGATELWVMNVSQALGQPVPCDGTSASCLRLTTTLWTGQPDTGPAHPYSHQFYGQTLIFYAAPVVGTAPYDGPVLAWRPGLTAPRQISGAHAASCDGHPRSDAALCVEDLQTTTNPVHFDLHAGRVAPTALPLAATIYPNTAGEAGQWSLAFSPAGDYFAYSTGGVTVSEPENLFAYAIDDVGTQAKRLTVATDVSQWDIATDSKHWYFMRGFNYPPRASVVDPSGTLVMADFPGGGGERTIATQVGAYVPLGDAETDRGVAFLADLVGGRGTYKIISNPAQSTTAATVASGVYTAVGSPDGRFSFLQTQFNNTTLLSDARVVRNDGTGNCALAPGTTSDVYGDQFLPGGGLVFWADNVDPNTGAAEGWLANPDGCSAKQKFATDVDFWFAAGDAGLIFSDNVGPTTSTVRFAKLGAGAAWPAAGSTVIRAGADRVFGLLEPDRQYVIFDVNAGGADDGLWIYGPIGFGQP
ncbi:MAG TPA: hypothetical protein VH374_01130 [Polyangia bacterium]|jgi:hypothetical protein|nr:hypothetical protein [Polyangia bacterium]